MAGAFWFWGLVVECAEGFGEVEDLLGLFEGGA